MNSDLPWWLEPGSERCPFCEGREHFEAMAYCANCDRPICPVCAAEFNRRLVCPECHTGDVQ